MRTCCAWLWVFASALYAIFLLACCRLPLYQYILSIQWIFFKIDFFLLRFSRRFAVFISVLLLFLGNSARRLCEKFMFRGFYSFCIPIFFLILGFDSVVSSEQWIEREKEKISSFLFQFLLFTDFLLVCFFHCFARFLVDSKETIKLNEKSLRSAIYQMTRLIQNAYTHSCRPARPHRYRVEIFKWQFKDVIFFPPVGGGKIETKKKK